DDGEARPARRTMADRRRRPSAAAGPLSPPLSDERDPSHGDAMNIELLLLLAGLLHFTLLPVSIAVPIVLDWKHHLLALAPFSRRIVWVHGAFIVFTVIGFGVLTIAGRHDI